MEMGEASVRLREAISLDDVALVQRILKNKPNLLQNPNYEDKSNTSLHLAALHGQTEIAEYLISLGHDREPEPVDEDFFYSPQYDNLGVSVNTDGHCPLHIAAMYSHPDVVLLLCQQFPNTINRTDKKGCTALHLAAGAHAMPRGRIPATRARATSAEDTSVVEHLIAHGADIEAQDRHGNTSLHYATAWGNLKAIRALMQAGAVPISKNWAGWTPDNYSLTVQAEVYYRAMINEWERRLDEEALRENERRAQQGGRSVRLVAADESDDLNSEYSRGRADSERSQTTTRSGSDAGLGISVGKTDTWM